MVFKDDVEYSEEVIRLLASNLENADVMNLFQQVIRFRDFGFKKAYLTDWNTKRRRYDNALLILEATKFITRNDDGPSTPYYPTTRGTQLAEYLINEADYDPELFKRIRQDEYEAFILERKKIRKESRAR